MHDIVIITGPTATGKSDSAVEFAKKFNGEIVSADSMLVYKGMNIGTAKPTFDQLASVPHHMVDVADPKEDFSAALWQRGAIYAIDDILSRGKLPVIVGGTGLYVRSVLYPMDFAGAKSDDSVREKWEKFLKENGPELLHDELKKVDPDEAEKLPVGDTRRTIRALEIFELTGKSKTQTVLEDRMRPPRYNALTMAVDMPRDVLYDRINRRVDITVKDGLVEEVKALLDSGVPKSATSMQGLGYKEIAMYLNMELTLEEALELLKRKTRNFAKRQLTWFRRYDDIIWLHADKNVEKSEMLAFFAENHSRR